MKYLLLVLSLLSVNTFAQTYDTDVADIFAGENQVEDSLNMANEILCIISKLGQNSTLIRVLTKQTSIQRDAENKQFKLVPLDNLVQALAADNRISNNKIK